MEVKENLILFKVLWSGEPEKGVATQRTKDVMANWLSNEALEVELISCGAPKNGPISFIFESHYSETDEDKAILKMNLRKLIKVFYENKDVEKLWLQWNDVTDDIIWEDYGTAPVFNDVEHEKGDYILIYQIKAK